MNYKVTRIGLLNFWLYDDEEFDFEDGKLLLRGTNGSGKSVTMQSFIPLILDGNKNPSRLDPFGSKDKRIEDYLLGSSDSDQKDEATGYLFMEFYNEKKYLSIGMGLKAKKGRPTDFWGFVIKDGKRIGKDLLLYHSREEKIPCSKKELRAKLGSDNVFVETAKEYKEAVNKNLFGFPNLDMYDEFINLLLQLRSPKLSKEYKPTKLMEILSGVLQPLTEEDLRPLSEAIEEMDSTKEKIEKLEKDVKSVSNLLITYNNYNETLLYKKAESYLNSKNEENKLNKNLNELSIEIENIQNNLKEIENQITNLETEKEEVKVKRANLDSTDLESKINRYTSLEAEIKNEISRKDSIQNELNKNLNRITDIQNNIQNLNNKKDKEEITCLDIYKDINELCDEIKFNEPALVLKDFNKDSNVLTQFSYLKTRLSEYKNKLENIKKELINKEKLEEKISDIENDKSKKVKKINSLNLEIDKVKENISDELLNLKDQIAYLNKSNKIIKFTTDELNHIKEPLGIYNKTSYETAKNRYLTLASKYKDSYQKDLFNITNKINIQNEKINKLIEEIETLKQTKEIEILKDEDDINTINYLNNNVKYVEFYKAIEFKDNIDEKLKDKIEANLYSSGILKSFIVENLNDVKNLKGNFITPYKKQNENLTKYFKPVSNLDINENTITKVLESISVDKNSEIYLNENNFKMSFLSIKGSQDYKTTYIGILKRKQALEAKIKSLNQSLEAEKDILNNLDNMKLNKQEDIKTILEETKLFPNNNLDVLAQNLDKLNLHLDIISKEINTLDEKLINLKKELDSLFKKLTILKKDINFPLYLETFEEALNDTSRLIDNLSEFEIKVNSLYQIKDNIFVQNERLDSINNIINDLNSSINEINLIIHKHKAEKKTLEEILHSKEYSDLSKQILSLDKRLEEIDKEMKELIHNQGKNSESLKNKKDELITSNMKVKEIEDVTKKKESFLKDEYNLNYVFKDEFIDPIKTSKQILNKLSSRKNSDMENALSNYFEAYNKYRVELNDYHLVSKTIFEDENKRNDLTASYQGKSLNLYNLSSTLNEAISENNQIINEQDRHLFEEILLKTVGSKIRARIESSKNWVKKINEIMNKMQKDSSLSFGLIWKSKDAESMEELETKELVRIFQIDANMITKNDSDKLIKHFRSKLKRLTELNNESDTYSSIIFEVLDYRNWFEFKMNYQRKGDNKKELTNKVFSVFSGGEKAKTMYIPLFAAVYAKLRSAYEDAPRIIALDEAFAGVDDNNIREMFGILSSLKLDYILTSQALWGDYDTINSLGISELLRPNNSSSVCVRRYKWNGKYKEIVTKREINDASELF